MLIEKLLNSNGGSMGPLAVHVLLQLVILMAKQKSQRNIFEWIVLLLSSKIMQEAIYLTSSNLG